MSYHTLLRVPKILVMETIAFRINTTMLDTKRVLNDDSYLLKSSASYNLLTLQSKFSPKKLLSFLQTPSPSGQVAWNSFFACLLETFCRKELFLFSGQHLCILYVLPPTCLSFGQVQSLSDWIRGGRNCNRVVRFTKLFCPTITQFLYKKGKCSRMVSVFSNGLGRCMKKDRYLIIEVHFSYNGSLYIICFQQRPMRLNMPFIYFILRLSC